jgi:hypothetical protein
VYNVFTKNNKKKSSNDNLGKLIKSIPPRWYLHLVESTLLRVRGLVCTNELESYAGSNIAAGRATHGGQILREMPD